MESGIWIILTYYTVGYAPAASRFFSIILGVCGGSLDGIRSLLFYRGPWKNAGRCKHSRNLHIIVDDLQPWMKWAYYLSPMSYGQNTIVIVEFLDPRWSLPNVDLRFAGTSAGKELLKARGMFTEEHWYWICVITLFGFSLFFNLCFILININTGIITPEQDNKRGMVLPFKPLSLLFDHEMRSQGVEETRLQLLRDVNGAFRPGVLTDLMGVSGAGKTTLMDVIAGRKMAGYIEEDIKVSGYPKNQETFARVSRTTSILHM
ncbi:hypothetical protein ACS0TY_028811 [Phlomoides rotata]